MVDNRSEIHREDRDEPAPEGLEKLLASVRAGRKYRHVDPDLVRAIGAAELKKGRKLRDAVKATRSQLHQSAGAYQLGRMDYAGWIKLLSHEYPGADPEGRRRLVTPMLAAHASTRERLSILTDFYERLFSALPPVRSVLDLACGLNPLALPWMGLPPGSMYHAWDIYADQVDFLTHFVRLAGYEGEVVQKDVLSADSMPSVDLVLVLKTIPCLEQISRDAGRRLVDRLNARYWAISFPVTSLGGRQKGMRESYAERFDTLMQGRGKSVARFDFESELLFVVSTE